jgi:tRNA-modifying protein YgfZ
VTSQPVDRHALAQLQALERDRAFAELRGWRLLVVRGADARGWLHDLITADVRTLEPGGAGRSLVLSPTGRIRADLHVALHADGFLLLQDPTQPEPIEAILSPYILSSDVELSDVSRRLAAFAVIGGDASGDGVTAEDGAIVWSPSPLGVGAGVVVDAGEPARRLRAALATDLVEALPEALERWRIRRGIPRMGADFGTDALPAETGLEGTIDFTKGCFLGQESVAKVRNLGHPPRAILSVRSGDPLVVGMPVRSGDATVGEVTSVAADDASLGIVRVRWGAAGEALTTAAGPLSLR